MHILRVSTAIVFFIMGLFLLAQALLAVTGQGTWSETLQMRADGTYGAEDTTQDTAQNTMLKYDAAVVLRNPSAPQAWMRLLRYPETPDPVTQIRIIETLSAYADETALTRLFLYLDRWELLPDPARQTVLSWFARDPLPFTVGKLELWGHYRGKTPQLRILLAQQPQKLAQFDRLVARMARSGE